MGKTTICWRLADLLRAQGLSVGGILTPALLDGNGNKVGIRALDLPAREERTLALKRETGRGLRVGPYVFDDEALAWGRQVILNALTHHHDLVIVDEIGRLELERNLGFHGVAENLPQDRAVLLVMRDQLMEILRERLDIRWFEVFQANRKNRDELPRTVAEALLPGRSLR